MFCGRIHVAPFRCFTVIERFYKIDDRITSYNVCYTKLLRKEKMMKIQQNKIVILFLSVMLLFGYDGNAQERKLSLEEVKSLALENNKKLQKAQKSLEAAQVASASAKAGGKPTVDASATGIYLSDPLNTLLPEYQGSGVLSVSQVLYAGGKVHNANVITSYSIHYTKLYDNFV